MAGQHGRTRATASILASLTIAVVGTLGALNSPCRADVYDVDVQLAAEQMSFRPVEVRVSGVSTSCAPQLAHVARTANTHLINMYIPSGSCADVVAPWEETVHLGHLRAGTHEVRACILGDECSSTTIFSVTDAVAAALFGANQSRVVCRNRSTGQRIVVRNVTQPIDCEFAGLVVNPGDAVSVRVFGVSE